MSDIDPRLRGDASGPATAYLQQQRLPGTTLPPIAANLPGLPSGQQSQSQSHYPPLQEDSPQQGQYHTPPSGDDHGSADAGPDGNPNDPKRPRACEACRGLKVRCEPVPNNPDGPCKRCAKANRNCVVTVPSRKRQKKTDSRVAELEKKIDALTATLQASKGGPVTTTHNSDAGAELGGLQNAQSRHHPYEQVTNGSYGSSPFAARPSDPRMRANEWSGFPKLPEYERKASAPPMVMAGQKRKHTGSPSDTRSPMSTGAARKSTDATPPSLHPVYMTDKQPQTHEYADVIDRGIVTTEMASRMFDCYVERMAPHMPAVVFPLGTVAADIRKTKPILFLAILSTASGPNYPELQKLMTKEVMSILADRIICSGEKSLELIQALLVSTLWYWPPEHFEELKFYQLIHIAAVMAIDIGMGKKVKAKQKISAGLWKDHPWRRTPFPDPETAEARRAWLACYFVCCNASMGLRRPNLIRWTSFMADCIEFLESSPEALPSDRSLCQWVRSQHIAEEVGTQFSMDDPVATVSIADTKVQYALKGFERDLEKWSSQVTPEALTRKWYYAS